MNRRASRGSTPPMNYQPCEMGCHLCTMRIIERYYRKDEYLYCVSCCVPARLQHQKLCYARCFTSCIEGQRHVYSSSSRPERCETTLMLPVHRSVRT